MRAFFALIDMFFVLSCCYSDQTVTTVLFAEGNQTDKLERQYAKRATEMVSNMSPLEKVYQTLMLPVTGSKASDVNAKNFTYAPGAVILFGFNFADVHANECCDFLHCYSNQFKSKSANGIVPFFATDNEGGSVFRTKRLTTVLPYAYTVADRFTCETARALYENQAKQMKLLGLNTNLGPICETGDAETGVLGYRVFSQSPETVSQYAQAQISAMQEQGMLPVVKHFPGSGNTDTHRGVSVVGGDYDTVLEACESFRLPLKSVGAVMLSHTIVPAIDNVPFCMSKKGIDFLKNEFRFQGIIISDDIIMQGLRQYESDVTRLACTLLKAGVDMVLYSASDFYLLAADIEKKAASDPVLSKRIDEAVTKILITKMEYGILETDIPVLYGTGSGRQQTFDWETFNSLKTAGDAMLKNDESKK